MVRVREPHRKGRKKGRSARIWQGLSAKAATQQQKVIRASEREREREEESEKRRVRERERERLVFALSSFEPRVS